MRVGVLGASGRIGTRLVESVTADPGLDLVAALVSPGSRFVGQRVGTGVLEYRPPDYDMRCYCDVIIDFSTPAATLAFQALLRDLPIPMVIGTTGFTAEQDQELSRFSQIRPLLIDANFAFGFEAFKQSVMDFAERMPGAFPQVSETYHSRKKPEPSGTTQMLAAALNSTRSKAIGFDVSDTLINVKREGNSVGINEVRFDLGPAAVTFNFTVETLAAYAEGAISAAQWLVREAPDHGRYSTANTLSTS